MPHKSLRTYQRDVLCVCLCLCDLHQNGGELNLTKGCFYTKSVNMKVWLNKKAIGLTELDKTERNVLCSPKMIICSL
jgi:hypothetical protein